VWVSLLVVSLFYEGYLFVQNKPLIHCYEGIFICV
jgi:hypothetical protein